MEAAIANLSRRQRDAKSDNLEGELHDSKLDVNALKRLLRISSREWEREDGEGIRGRGQYRHNRDLLLR